MPRGAFAGLIYWLCFCALIFFALRHDLAINQADRQSGDKPPIVREQGSAAAAGQEHGSHQEGKESWWDRLWTDPVATFTAALAIFTFVLAGVAIWQGLHLQRSVEIATRAANIAEDSLLTLERPLVYFFGRSGEQQGGLTGDARTVIRGDFRNLGRTPAHVTNIVTKVVFGKELPDDPDYDRCTDINYNIVLSPSQSKEVTFDFDGVVTADEWSKQKEAGFRLAIYGYFVYKGLFDIEYTVGFCLVHDTTDNGFRVLGGAAYNYEKKRDYRAQAGAAT